MLTKCHYHQSTMQTKGKKNMNNHQEYKVKFLPILSISSLIVAVTAGFCPASDFDCVAVAVDVVVVAVVLFDVWPLLEAESVGDWSFVGVVVAVDGTIVGETGGEFVVDAVVSSDEVVVVVEIVVAVTDAVCLSRFSLIISSLCLNTFFFGWNVFLSFFFVRRNEIPLRNKKRFFFCVVFVVFF